MFFFQLFLYENDAVVNVKYLMLQKNFTQSIVDLTPRQTKKVTVLLHQCSKTGLVASKKACSMKFFDV